MTKLFESCLNMLPCSYAGKRWRAVKEGKCEVIIACVDLELLTNEHLGPNKSWPVCVCALVCVCTTLWGPEVFCWVIGGPGSYLEPRVSLRCSACGNKTTNNTPLTRHTVSLRLPCCQKVKRQRCPMAPTPHQSCRFRCILTRSSSFCDF